MDMKTILDLVAKGQISSEEAYALIEQKDSDSCIDFTREKRTGVSEVIYGKGKTKEQIASIIGKMLLHGQKDILATRVDEEKYAYLKDLYPQFDYDPISQAMTYCSYEKVKNKGLIAVICAGTSDLYVANEAAITARFLGNEVLQINDVGVAGIHRLFNRLEEIQKASVIVVVAGMEGALASVIGGLVSAPVIAVPTSVGYGANFNGLSALLSMLNSCASGVSVVNIDNGFGAGYMAHTINCLGGKQE